MQIIYLGNNTAMEVAEIEKPTSKDFHDPMHFDMQCDVYAEHIAALRKFDVDPAFAATLDAGQIYDESNFKLKTIITK